MQIRVFQSQMHAETNGFASWKWACAKCLEMRCSPATSGPQVPRGTSARQVPSQSAEADAAGTKSVLVTHNAGCHVTDA